MRSPCLALTLALLAAPATWAQQAPASVASRDRDEASIYVYTMSNFVVATLGRECLALIGRAEPPQQLVTSWRERNAAFVAASTKYLDQRFAEAGDQRDAAIAELNRVAQAGSDLMLRSVLQGRKEDACMRAVTLLEAGAFDITTKTPQYERLEGLLRWASK